MKSLGNEKRDKKDKGEFQKRYTDLEKQLFQVPHSTCKLPFFIMPQRWNAH